MAERDTRFGGNLETANIRPREYQPSDRGIANVSNVDDRSLFQRGADVGKNIYETVNPFIPEYRDDMMNWNVNTDYGRFGLGVGRGKGMLNWSLPFNISALDGGLGSTNEYQMAELSLPQQKHMSGFYGNPTHYSTSPEGFENYKLGVEGHEEKPWFGLFGGQEKATDQEIRDELIKNIKNKQRGDDTPLLRNFSNWGLV